MTPRRRAVRRRRRVALALVVAVGAAVAAVAYASGSGGGRAAAFPPAHCVAHAARARVRTDAARRTTRTRRVVSLRERPAGRLPFALKDAAAAAVPGRGIALAGGLSSADLSLDEVVVSRAGASRSIGKLPDLQHDAPGVRIGTRLYAFGGGNGVAQLATITGVDLATGRTTEAGTLPAPSWDSAAAANAGVAYVVGGYTGTRWLDTIVAWRPGGRARIVARLPQPVRYAAVTFAAGLLVIAAARCPTAAQAARC